jgi:hypothetical protein
VPAGPDLGPLTLSVSFGGDPFYQPANASAGVLAYAFPTGGAFVIGDRSTTPAVTFYSGRWRQVNAISGGPVPAGFRGFENSLATPTCGDSWLQRRGSADAQPPATVPSYMGVIVTSSVTKSGRVYGGTIVRVVVVRTDPGYAPIRAQNEQDGDFDTDDAAHVGTGTIVATICGP